MGIYKESQRKEYATIGKDSFPIGDKAHARAALSRINQGNLSPAEKAKVRAKAKRMLGERKGGGR